MPEQKIVNKLYITKKQQIMVDVIYYSRRSLNCCNSRKYIWTPFALALFYKIF